MMKRPVKSVWIRKAGAWWKPWREKYEVVLSYQGGSGYCYPRTTREEAVEFRDQLIECLFEKPEPAKETPVPASSVDVGELRKRLQEMPDMVMDNERRNPAWSKSELWGIERDIIPSIRALCRSAAALLPTFEDTDQSPTAP